MAISPQQVIYFVFVSKVGFLGSVDRMALFQVWSNSRWRPASILKYYELPYLHKWWSDPLRVWF